MWMVLGQYNVLYALLLEVGHFVLGFLVGWLAFWWMRTTLSRINSAGRLSLMPGSFIYRYSLLFALLLSVWAHIVEDYTVNLF